MAMLKTVENYAIDSHHFSFKAGVFVAEASDLKHKCLEQRIYDDACDVGFAIRSVLTGHVVVYCWSREVKDRDGDVQYWEYIPCPEHARKFPQVANTKVVIFND